MYHFQQALAQISASNKMALLSPMEHTNDDEHVYLAAPFVNVQEKVCHIYPLRSRVNRNLLMFGMSVNVAKAIEDAREKLPEGFDAIELSLPTGLFFSEESKAGGGLSIIDPVLLPGDIHGLTPLGERHWAYALLNSDLAVFPTKAVLRIGREGVSILATVEKRNHVYTVTASVPNLVEMTEKALDLAYEGSKAAFDKMFGRVCEAWNNPPKSRYDAVTQSVAMI